MSEHGHLCDCDECLGPGVPTPPPRVYRLPVKRKRSEADTSNSEHEEGAEAAG